MPSAWIWQPLEGRVVGGGTRVAHRSPTIYLIIVAARAALFLEGQSAATAENQPQADRKTMPYDEERRQNRCKIVDADPETQNGYYSNSWIFGSDIIHVNPAPEFRTSCMFA